MTADLHCHTIFSDGSTSPKQLVLLAKEAGLSAIAVTDHDSMAGVAKAQEYGSLYGIKVVAGVEFSCFDPARGRKAHLLCYLPKYPEALAPLCEETTQRRRAAAFQMANMVAEKYPVSVEQILEYAAPSTNIYKQHMMRALMEAGCAKEVYGAVFKELFDPKTGSCYLDPGYPDIWEVLGRVKEAKGIAVLAHPSSYRSMDLLRELCEAEALDGIEVNHPRNTPEDTAEAKRLAERCGLIMTGGTDFHGMYTARTMPLGSFTAPNGQLERLLERASQL